jgi:hypothetical protein
MYLLLPWTLFFTAALLDANFTIVFMFTVFTSVIKFTNVPVVTVLMFAIAVASVATVKRTHCGFSNRLIFSVFLIGSLIKMFPLHHHHHHA